MEPIEETLYRLLLEAFSIENPIVFDVKKFRGTGYDSIEVERAESLSGKNWTELDLFAFGHDLGYLYYLDSEQAVKVLPKLIMLAMGGSETAWEAEEMFTNLLEKLRRSSIPISRLQVVTLAWTHSYAYLKLHRIDESLNLAELTPIQHVVSLLAYEGR